MNNLKYLSLILNTDYTNWSEFYQNIDSILEELEELISNNEILPFEIKNKIFWFFRNYFSCYKNQISILQAQKLNNIIIRILQKDRCLYNLSSVDLSILEDMLIVLQRIFYLHLELEGNLAILNSLIKAATLKKDLNSTKNAVAFIIALLGCFKICLFNHKINTSTQLIRSTQAIQEFFIEQLIWNENDPVAILVHGLLFLKELRFLYKDNSEIYSIIDYYAAKFCDIAMHDIPRVYPFYSINLIKEDIGASYVKYLEPEYWDCFNGVYKILCPKDILPQEKLHSLTGDNNLPKTYIKINHNELTFAENQNLENLINEVCSELKAFLKLTKIKCLKKEEINIELNLFNDQKQFERYGYLVWNVDSSGGGICISGINNQPTTAFVYQIDHGFLNLKHELTHAFMDNILGSYYTECLAGVFTEGLADFFDKGPSNHNKLMQMQRLLLREPLKTLPEIVTMNEGGSVVYLYGYFLIHYLISEKVIIFSKILTEVQNKNLNQVTKLVAQFGLEQKDNFHEWIYNKLSNLIILLFKAIREQDRGSVNLLLAGMNSLQVNLQEETSKNTSLHIAIETWTQQKDTLSRTNALSIIWSILLKGAELKNVQNANGKFPIDLIEDTANRGLIESYARDAKHYIDLKSNAYIERAEESTIC